MQNGVEFIVSSKADSLEAYLGALKVPTGTIEAEYGDRVVKGSAFTMAHHGSRTGQKAPCAYANGEVRLPDGPFHGVIGLSHLDSDALGGIMAALETKPDDPKFWTLVEQYDVHGLHTIDLGTEDPLAVRKLFAQLAYFSVNKLSRPKDGSVGNVTKEVMSANETSLQIISAADATLLLKGDLFRERQDELNRASFVRFDGGAIFRESRETVNHLYKTPDGVLAQAVVNFNPGSQGITLSFADKPRGRNAIQILSEIIPGVDGDDPGGHPAIAGSRRDGTYRREDAEAVFRAVVEELRELASRGS